MLPLEDIYLFINNKPNSSQIMAYNAFLCDLFYKKQKHFYKSPSFHKNKVFTWNKEQVQIKKPQ